MGIFVHQLLEWERDVFLLADRLGEPIRQGSLTSEMILPEGLLYIIFDNSRGMIHPCGPYHDDTSIPALFSWPINGGRD